MYFTFITFYVTSLTHSTIVKSKYALIRINHNEDMLYLIEKQISKFNPFNLDSRILWKHQ